MKGDLERLIRDKQDALRGRPRDWIDDVSDWLRAVDWTAIVLIAAAFAAFVLVLRFAEAVLP